METFTPEELLKPNKKLSPQDIDRLLSEVRSTAVGTITASNEIVEAARKKLHKE